jgi:hypothetical protein
MLTEKVNFLLINRHNLNMTRILIMFLVIFSLSISVKGQLSDYEMQQQVLEKNIVDSLFVFGKWNSEGTDETHLKYLGKVLTKDGQVLKIMNSCWLWGLSKRATNRILIFKEKNQPLGNYSGLLMYELPTRLVKGKLIFTNTDKEECDINLKTTIDFRNGIPEQIFIKCKGDYGNLYTFSHD